jgi:hypothetical protein
MHLLSTLYYLKLIDTDQPTDRQTNQTTDRQTDRHCQSVQQ